MNAAHLHLILNHIPPITVIIALVLLIVGIIGAKKILVQTAVWIFLAASIITVPVYLTGDAAKEAVEHLAGTSESMTHNHEEMAEKAFIASIVMGIVSILGLLLGKANRKIPGWMTGLILVIGLIVGLLMIYTANLGGKIRRPELRTSLQSEFDKD
jgi:uncharacterized membrane protein